MIQSARLFVEYGVGHEITSAPTDGGRDIATGVVNISLASIEPVAIRTEAATVLDTEKIA